MGPELTVLKDRIPELRPAYLPPDPVSRTSYQAGEVAQCDLQFPLVRLPVGFGQVPQVGAVAAADDGDQVLLVAVWGGNRVGASVALRKGRLA